MPDNTLPVTEIRFGWSIKIKPEEYCAMMGTQLERVQARPGWEAALHSAATELAQVIHPAACWARHPVQAALHDKLVLNNRVRIGEEQVVSVMGAAREVILVVCTLGSGADRAADAAQRAGNYLKAFLLHELASMAVDDLRQQVCRELEVQVRQEGLYSSAPLSPGESSWKIDDQAVIFALLETEKIGVTLNESCLMTPLMSLSLMLGVASQPFETQGSDNCLFCTLRERCNYRRLRKLTNSTTAA